MSECRVFCVTCTAALLALMRYKWWFTENGWMEGWMDGMTDGWVIQTTLESIPCLITPNLPGWVKEMIIWFVRKLYFGMKTKTLCLVSAFQKVAFNNVEVEVVEVYRRIH